jgi:hypothetical protein
MKSIRSLMVLSLVSVGTLAFTQSASASPSVTAPSVGAWTAGAKKYKEIKNPPSQAEVKRRLREQTAKLRRNWGVPRALLWIFPQARVAWRVACPVTVAASVAWATYWYWRGTGRLPGWGEIYHWSSGNCN